MTFAEAARKTSAMKLTENGAVAYDNLHNPVLELFATIGGLRDSSEETITEKFRNALQADAKLTAKMMFYCGDIREGLGERRVFRICLKWMAINYPSFVRANLHNIAFYNRFDSLFTLFDTPCEWEMLEYVKSVLFTDINNMNEDKSVSLLAKWMPSINASSIETKQKARRIARFLGWSERQYRKTLSSLRHYLHIVEVSMTTNKWHEIEYSHVPSKAMNLYHNAFLKHDESNFTEYIINVKHGVEKINSSVLYPYDLVRKYIDNRGMGLDDVIEEQWKALPNYVTDKNVLIMADVSGSMFGRPMETSIGLATYFAQHNTGDFKNLLLTFTSTPFFIDLSDCATLNKAVRKIMVRGVGYSTDLEAAFQLVLDSAIRNNVSPEEMPSAIVVISDMEIDYYMRYSGVDFVDEMRTRFEEAGYKLPKLITWNVEARNDTFLSQDDTVIQVSGQSINTFNNLMSALNGKTAYEFMLDVLNDSRYERVIF